MTMNSTYTLTYTAKRLFAVWHTVTLLLLAVIIPQTAFADDDPEPPLAPLPASDPVVRYVKTTANGGTTDALGSSWGNAMNNLQKAIDQVYDDIKEGGTYEGHPGYVYVAGYDARAEILNPGVVVGERAKGTYYPSESLTGDAKRQSNSFLMKEGVTVICGFEGNGSDATKTIGSVTVPDPDQRIRIYLDNEGHETSNIDDATWHMRYQTILSGNYQKQQNPNATEGVDTKFTWNETKQKFDTEFPGNTTHVVSFATNGFYSSSDVESISITGDYTDDQKTTIRESLIGHAKPLTKKAVLDGAVVEHGNAINNSLEGNHPQNAYGGGIYMVPNAETMGCEVRYCAASRDGGGVYMDGGGRNEHLYVHHCQTLGIGIQHGYGGGVAINNSGLLLHSFVINNVARMGGGLSMKHNEVYAKAIKATGYTAEEISSGRDDAVAIDPEAKHSAFCAATLIANNTATTEAGGAYLMAGTALNSVSVVRNRCNGSGARIDNIVTGLSGGVFARGAARIYNSLLWGNSVGAYAVGTDGNGLPGSTVDTDDLQFSAYSTSSTDKSELYYVALSNSDRVNWSHSSMSNILSLAVANIGNDRNQNYATLVRPSSVTGYDNTVDYLADYNYQPNFNSSLVTNGVLLDDIGHDLTGPKGIKLGEIDTDIYDLPVSPRCDIGAYVSVPLEITFRMMPDIDELEAGVADPTLIPTIFVDPNRHSGNAEDNGAHGHSWEHPVMQLRNANNFFQEGQDLDGDKHFTGTYTYYDSPEATTPVTGAVNAEKVQVLMKQGTVYTVSTHTHARLRATSVFMIDNCAIYGGYYGGLKDTDLKTDMGRTLTTPVGRNPLVYRSVISGAAAGGNYNTNVARLVQVEGVSNSILDGVELREGNSAIKDEHNNVVAMTKDEALQYGEDSPMSELTTSQGAAIYIRNDLRHDEIGTTNKYKVVKHPEGLEMENIQFRNCIIVGNTAEQGAAVYAYGIEGTSTTGKLDVKFVNCIFHNNSVKANGTVPEKLENGKPKTSPEGAKAADGHGIIYAAGSKLTLDINHCDFLRNVGNPIVIDAGATVKLNNSILYANLCQEVENTNDHDNFVMKSIVNASDGSIYNGGNLTGSNNFFDKGANNINDALSAYGTVNLTYTYPDESYTYPRFENPTKHSGVTPGGDITYYGYATSFMPMSMNPLTNAANGYGSVTKDITSITPRTYGGAPDCGAVENNVHQQEVGAVMYVRDYTSTGSNHIKTYDKDGGGTLTENATGMGRYAADGHELDGSSWRYAINGNAVYGQEYSKDVRGLQWAVNTQAAKPAPATKDNNYQVWVGAGVYKADNLIKDKDGDKGNSCFVIRDHVNVYGAFPKTGSPSIDERHPLLSQYVFKPEEVTDKVADYETILEPIDQYVKTGNANRVLGQTYTHNPKRSGYTDFKGCEWDGFTLRKGVLDAKLINQQTANGGAGLIIYKNVIARNMVITENTQFFNGEFRGGAVYIGGGTAENLYIINNKMHGWNYTGTDGSKNKTNAVGYGGGAYLRHECTMYNCVVYGNTIECNYADGAGLFLDGVANFFNNTVVKNVATGNVSSIGGLATWTTGSSTQLNLYNCIIHGNTDNRKGNNLGDQNIGIRQKGVINVINSLVEEIPSSKKYGSGDKAIYYSTTAGQEVKAAAEPSTIFNHVGTDFLTSDYRLLSSETNPAINTGLDAPIIDGVAVDLSGYTDMDYAQRIQDCRIDMGAFEYNGARNINPELRNDETGVVVVFDTQTDAQLAGHTAYFYVSENGRGNTAATNPSNAACWQKIQKVLDSAGRYKFTHPGLRVVVKLAGTAENMDGKDESQIFKYSPRRSAVPENKDSREYSLLVPRGVEVWGGYYASNNTVKKAGAPNAPANDFREQDRSIIEHQTFLDGNYDTPAIENLVAYHVLTFTDKVFDVNGIALTTKDLNEAFGLAADYSGDYKFGVNGDPGTINNKRVRDVLSSYIPLVTGSENVTFASLEKQIESVEENDFGRAVVDGIFVTGGKATGSNNAYGGGGVATDYSFIRNCIFTDNEATEGGGALLLKPGAIVSGTLFRGNNAAMGGALYFQPWEDGELDAMLAKRGITDESSAKDRTEATALSMAAVVMSTVVDNTASQTGGGVWFTDNARFSTSVFWGNHCGNMKNIAGQYSSKLGSSVIDEITTYVAYPFSYSAVENLRVPGVNNIEVSPLNSQGVRFTLKSGEYDGGANENRQENIDPYYLPTVFSDLVNTGMSKSLYTQNIGGLVNSFSEFTDKDFKKVGRLREGYNKLTIGALAQFAQNDGPLLTRLYVAKSADVDRQAQIEMQNLPGSTSNAYDKIYRQQGSSFAYPFKDLEDALAYIREHRKPENTSLYNKHPYKNGAIDNSATAVNTEFEIIMAGGTYWPTADITGKEEYALGFTFLIPEYVKIIGGFDCKALTTEFVNNNGLTGKGGDVGKFFGQKEGTLTNPGDKIAEWNYLQMMLPRAHYDNNANDIVEPWEFTNRTVLSGLTVNATDYFSNYHVCTVIADPKYVGQLPAATSTNPNYDSATVGTVSYETGHPIEINGVEIADGDAWDYAVGSAGSMTETEADLYQLYSYEHGGGIVVDGNWYGTVTGSGSSTVYTEEYKHTAADNPVAYRDIPIEFNKCQFINNKAGYGGAISSNTTVRLYNSLLASNLAYSGYDKDMENHKENYYPGVGGAVYITKAIVAINDLFENNEARETTDDPSVPVVSPNEPRAFPTYRNDQLTTDIFPGAGGCIYGGMNTYYIHVLNCDFVRNKANVYPVVFTRNHNPRNVILNSIFWGNEGTYNGSLTAGVSPLPEVIDEQGQGIPLYPNSIYNSVSTSGYDRNNYIWFSAYEEGRGPKAVLEKDLRTKPFRIYTDANRSELDNDLGGELPKLGDEVVSFDRIAAEEQNSNIIISSTNSALDGPNFGNPSQIAGVIGYAQDADFMPTRVNRLSDAGWGWLKQNADNTDFATEGYDAEHFDDGIGAAPGTAPTHDTTTLLGGAYSYIYAYNNANTAKMPFGKTTYMLLNEANESQAKMHRIALMPPPVIGEGMAYIDLGVYEHKNEPLMDLGGKHIHELWVAPEEKLENGVPDGSCWQQPTSDLQRAINTLLANRCGCPRDKVIHLIEGEYTPLDYDSHFNYGFEINTGGLNLSANNVYDDEEHMRETYKESFVNSLVFDGGYSNSITTIVNGKQQGIRNYEKYPTIITSDQTNGTSHHLFNITDARQWYGCGPAQNVEQYSEVHTQSLLRPADDATPTVIPLHFEGVIFENDKATGRPESPSSEDIANGIGLGAAIYYPVQKYYVKNSDATKISYIDDEDRNTANPLLCNAPQTHTDAGNIYKLNVAQSVFRLNGMKAEDSEAGKTPASALYVAAGSGPAVVYNSLFHSNYGNTVNGTDIKLVNNTIALNHGKIDLTTYADNGTAANNALIGNILWRNHGNMVEDATMALDQEYTILDGTEINNNAITCASVPAETPSVHANSVLDKGNTEATGPGFVSDFYGTEAMNPNTATPEQKRTFDFHIPVPKASLISEMVTADAFYNAVFGTSLSEADAKAKMNAIGAVQRDLAYGLRLMNMKLERGAYENQVIFHRVFFCTPATATTNWADEVGINDRGRIWAYSYPDNSTAAQGTLQDAINAAHMYFLANGANDQSEAYVFVKESNEEGSPATRRILDAVNIPDGVRVIGSIPSSFNENCGILTESNISNFPTYEPSNVEIASFVTKVEQTRRGLLAPDNTTRTKIKGISASGAYNYGAVADGFEVTEYNWDHDSDPATPQVSHNGLLSLKPVSGGSLQPVVLRNAYVHNSDISVDGALLYDVFMHDNGNIDVKSSSVAVNVTSTQPLGAVSPLVSRIHSGMWPLTMANSADGFTTGFDSYPAKALLYQLDDEKTDLIDQILIPASGQPAHDAWDMTKNPATAAVLSRYVNYLTDRDLLGNPRLINGAVDAGCFETWYLDNGNEDVAMYQPEKVVSRNGESMVWEYYPHSGSMVYVTDGASLVLDPKTMNDPTGYDAVVRHGLTAADYREYTVDAVKHYDYTFRPYYFLIDKGASLYSQGVGVDMDYLALRRTIDEAGSVVNLPFAIVADADGTYYKYDGSSRSAATYDWKSADSPCWTAVAEDVAITANTAFLFRPSAPGADVHTFRAGSHHDVPAADAEQSVKDAYRAAILYSEPKASTYKEVTLTQHETTSASAPGKPNFTTKEDMGWNATGLPYLVSGYYTADKTDSDIHGIADKYMMHIPHVMWQYGEFTEDDGTPNGTYGYYHYNSWEPDASGAAPWLEAGEGIFMQTATLNATETLTFYRPVFIARAHRAPMRLHASRGIEEHNDSNSGTAELLRTEYYTTGGVRIEAPQRGAVTIRVDIYSDGTTRTRKTY